MKIKKDCSKYHPRRNHEIKMSSESAHVKKITTICKLLISAFDIAIIKLSEEHIAEITFVNKPNQPVRVQFLLCETWNVIKARVQKLQDSDGICVVCFEKEEETISRSSCFCQTCCEFLCMSCLEKHARAFKRTNCPVCRTYILTYHNKLQELKSKNEN